jgi:hypothetical protein
MRTLAIIALTLAAASTAWAVIPPGKTYDSAITCKGVALAAKNAGDARSKAALKLIDVEIEKEIARGKTRDQAAADVEYARYEYKDTLDQAAIDAEWLKCLDRWAPPA